MAFAKQPILQNVFLFVAKYNLVFFSIEDISFLSETDVYRIEEMAVAKIVGEKRLVVMAARHKSALEFFSRRGLYESYNYLLIYIYYFGKQH